MNMWKTVPSIFNNFIFVNFSKTILKITLIVHYCFTLDNCMKRMHFLIADAVWLSHDQMKKRLTKMKVRHKINYKLLVSFVLQMSECTTLYRLLNFVKSEQNVFDFKTRKWKICELKIYQRYSLYRPFSIDNKLSLLTSLMLSLWLFIGICSFEIYKYIRFPCKQY